MKLLIKQIGPETLVIVENDVASNLESVTSTNHALVH